MALGDKCENEIAEVANVWGAEPTGASRERGAGGMPSIWEFSTSASFWISNGPNYLTTKQKQRAKSGAYLNRLFHASSCIFHDLCKKTVCAFKNNIHSSREFACSSGGFTHTPGPGISVYSQKGTCTH